MQACAWEPGMVCRSWCDWAAWMWWKSCWTTVLAADTRDSLAVAWEIPLSIFFLAVWRSLSAFELLQFMLPSTSARSIASPFFRTGLAGELTRSVLGELKGEELVMVSTAAEPEFIFLSVNCSLFELGECIALSCFDCIISGDWHLHPQPGVSRPVACSSLAPELYSAASLLWSAIG